MPDRVFTADQEQQIAKEYQEGRSTYELAETYGHSPVTMSNIVRRQGGQVRPARPQSKWNAETKAAAIRLYRRGLPLRAVARQVGVRGSTVSAAIIDAGIALKPGGAAHATFPTSKDRERVRAEYESGCSLNELARRYGCSTQPVRRAIEAAGGKTRPTGRSAIWTAERIEWAAEQFRQGRTFQQIADETGMSPSNVYTRLRAAGVVGPYPKASGSAHGSWKGGRVAKGPYVGVIIGPDDPFASMAFSGRYVLEHRLVMARHLGRPLLRSETVHHINGDHRDNRIENLQLRQGNHGNGVVLVCCDCGSQHIEAREVS